MIPLVRGTVDNQRIPRIHENNRTVNSVLGKKIKIKNSKPLKEYNRANKFFFDKRSPK